MVGNYETKIRSMAIEFHKLQATVHFPDQTRFSRSNDLPNHDLEGWNGASSDGFGSVPWFISCRVVRHELIDSRPLYYYRNEATATATGFSQRAASHNSHDWPSRAAPRGIL